MTSEKSTKHLKIVFGGDSHEIDADVLIESLMNYSIVTQEASAYLSPDSKVNIRIKATQRGSFELLIDLIANAGNTLFTPQNIAYVSGLVTIVGGLYKFRQWLSRNGAPEKVEHNENGNTVKIKNNKGEIEINQTVFNIYQTSEATREGLRKTFIKLKDAGEIEDFEIVDQETNEEIFRANKNDFGPMSSEVGEPEQKKQTVVKRDQELNLFKIVFKEGHKWEFFYQNNRIYASVNDSEYVKKVTKGEIAFRSGDRIIADLEIIQVYHEAAGVFVNDEYHITKVKEHIPRSGAAQKPLEFIDKENDKS
ncbi:MAG: hypothetical protein WC905_01930 [Patescibacteria group bacterium]|jgi:hypothetical protein